MPDLRTQRSIAERNDLLWFRRAVPWRRWCGRASWGAALVAGALLVVWTVWGDERVYWSRPVSSAHAMFEQDCHACHVQKGAPLLRLATLNDHWHSVRDADCQQCHAESTTDHYQAEVTLGASGCVACHREHTDRPSLRQVADRHCITCHNDLEHAVAGGHTDFAAQVASFTSHPEFRIWRGEEGAAELSPDAKRHGLRERATFVPASAKGEGHWQDAARIKFNHRVHLRTDGLPMPWDASAATTAGPAHKTLACADCHQPDASGQYMQPIRYEQHCAECHRLEFSSKLAAGGPLPHEKPEIVLGVLRERLMAYAQEHPQAVGDASDSDTDEPRLPNKSLAEPTARDRWQWVDEQLAESSELLKTIQQGCTHCHETTSPAGDDAAAFAIVPPSIPDRWLVHSRFDHSRHREVSCVVCHDPQLAEREPRGHAKAGIYSQLASERTSDLLLPRLETCQQCHGTRPVTHSTRGARSGCVDCHDYHHTPASDSGKLDALLGHLRPKSAEERK